MKLAVIAGALAVGVAVQASPIVWSASAPDITGDNIGNLTGSGGVDANNVNAGDDVVTYIAANREGQGQTFTTGANAGGYSLTSVTLQQTDYTSGSSIDAGWIPFYHETFNLQVGTISGGTFTALYTEDFEMASSGQPANNSGDGAYFELALSTSQSLAANTDYAFMVYVYDDAEWGGPYLEINGSAADVFAGSAITVDRTSGAVTTQTGDRAFAVGLQAVPEPATIGLIGFFGASVFLIRRRLMI